MTTTLPVHIRWILRRDMAEVLSIEHASFPNPWSETAFKEQLVKDNSIGMVAEHDERVVGFMLYELHKASLHLLNFAVHPDYRRRGVGAAMLGKLIDKLTPERRYRLTLDVRETNLPAQLFFAEYGLRATEIRRGLYGDSDEDAYRMELFAIASAPEVRRVGLMSST